MTVAFAREPFERAVRRLPPFDLQALLGLALLADPAGRGLTGAWDAVAGALGTSPLLLREILSRLHAQGYVQGRVDAPEGLHLHLGRLLGGDVGGLPPNLPLEPSP